LAHPNNVSRHLQDEIKRNDHSLIVEITDIILGPRISDSEADSKEKESHLESSMQILGRFGCHQYPAHIT
jgi:hypothetical protein